MTATIMLIAALCIYAGAIALGLVSEWRRFRRCRQEYYDRYVQRHERQK